jgi:hypothetical protein
MTMTVGFIGLGQKRPETDLSGKIFRLISAACTELAEREGFEPSIRF